MSATLPASLEYYDSEKRVKPDAKPKRSIALRSCFSINPKFDGKNAHTLVLFTQDDSLGMVFENESEQQEWHQAIQALLAEEGIPPSGYGECERYRAPSHTGTASRGGHSTLRVW